MKYIHPLTLQEAKAVKTCPYCGKPVQADKDGRYYHIYCNHCGVRTRGYSDIHRAISDWHEGEIYSNSLLTFTGYADAE